MATDALSIAIVGGGQTGTSLIELLLKADFLNIVGAADLDDNATGIKLAEKTAFARPTTSSTFGRWRPRHGN